MLKRALKSIIRILITLVVSAAIGTLMLSLAYSLPTDRIWNNVEKSVEQIAMEGDHFSLFTGLKFTNQDNYTDAIYMNEALINNDAKGLFTGLIGLEYENKNLPIDYDSPVLLLKNVFQDDSQLEFKEQTTRFWNGYEVVVKILLCFFTYGQIRYINYIVELLLLLAMAMLMKKHELTRFIIPLFMSFLFLGPITMTTSMVFSGFMYCTYIPCIIMLLFNDKLRVGQRYPIFFLIIGIVMAYFNVNYFQLISFAYAFVFYCMLNDFPKSNREAFLTLISMFAYWLMGFDGMYVMKWIIYEILVGQPIISNMIARSLYRVSATAYYTGPRISRIKAMLKNIYYALINIPWLIVEICYIVGALTAFFKGKDRYQASELLKKKMPALILTISMLGIVLLRYIIFANHVYVHAWVTYRTLDSVILLFNVIIMNCISEKAANCAHANK